MKAQVLFNQFNSLDPQIPIEVYDTHSGIYKKVIEIKISKDSNLHVFVTDNDSKTLTVRHFLKVLIKYLDSKIEIIDNNSNAKSKPTKVQVYNEKNMLTDEFKQGVYLHCVY